MASRRSSINQTAEEVIKLLVKILAQFGLPKWIHPDQGRNVESFAFRKLCERFGIEKPHTTRYHPQGNGFIERANRSIIDINRKIGSQHEGHKVLPLVAFIYNTVKHFQQLAHYTKYNLGEIRKIVYRTRTIKYTIYGTIFMIQSDHVPIYTALLILN